MEDEKTYKKVKIVSGVALGLWLLGLFSRLLMGNTIGWYIELAMPTSFSQGVFGNLYYKYPVVYYFINLHLPVLLGIGLVIFSGKKRRGVALLRLVWLVVFLANAIELVLAVIDIPYFLIKRGVENWSGALLLILWPLTRMAYLYLSVVVLRQLAGYYRLKTEVYRREEYTQNLLVPTTRWARFGNYLIDHLVFNLLLYNSTWFFQTMFFNSSSEMGESGWFLYIVAPVMSLICYLITECFWHLTPGKCITLCMVTDEEGQALPASSRIGRTFARFIPFDGFSFLGSRGWHDSLSNSYVHQLMPAHIKSEIEKEIDQIGEITGRLHEQV